MTKREMGPRGRGNVGSGRAAVRSGLQMCMEGSYTGRRETNPWVSTLDVEGIAPHCPKGVLVNGLRGTYRVQLTQVVLLEREATH